MYMTKQNGRRMKAVRFMWEQKGLGSQQRPWASEKGSASATQLFEQPLDLRPPLSPA
jgi:hypothetical protein